MFEYSEKVQQQLREDYAQDVHRQCHICRTVIPLERIVSGGAPVQGFTGRVYCGQECWDEYRRREGL